MPRKTHDDITLPGDPDSREGMEVHVLSRSAWSSWLGVVVVFTLYGVFSDAPRSYYTIGVIGLILGLVPLWGVDRILHRIHQRGRK